MIEKSEQRQRIDALREQVREERRGLAVSSAEASAEVRDSKLDGEEARLEAELAMLRQANKTTDEVHKDPTKDELMERAAALDIEGRSSMTKDQLEKAIATHDAPSIHLLTDPKASAAGNNKE